MSEYLTPKQAAEELNVNRLTVYRMIHDGWLPASRVGKRGLRIPRAFVLEMLKPLETPQSGQP